MQLSKVLTMTEMAQQFIHSIQAALLLTANFSHTTLNTQQAGQEQEAGLSVALT